jgi:ubiquinone/menaquinone biosynthesis C-methylase UbiE
MMGDPKSHWEAVYRVKAADQVSWFQSEARISLDLIRQAAAGPSDPIIDVGGGASTLIDGLVRAGYREVTVLDLSMTALEQSKKRLGEAASQVTWIEGDVLEFLLPAGRYAIWHDRAVFHFLTSAADRRRYVTQLRSALRPGGQVILATFSSEGPERCSGLPVMRYDIEDLDRELGSGFRRLSEESEEHRTPSGAGQAFTYGRWELAPAMTG